MAPPNRQTLPSKESYANKNLTDTYQRVLERVFGAVLLDKGARDNAAKLAKGVLELETRLVNAVPPLDQLRDPNVSNHPMSLMILDYSLPFDDLRLTFERPACL